MYYTMIEINNIVHFKEYSLGNKTYFLKINIKLYSIDYKIISCSPLIIIIKNKY